MTIAVAIDHTIRQPDGSLVPGADEAVRQLMAHEPVIAYTSQDPAAASQFLRRHGIPAVWNDFCGFCDGRGRHPMTLTRRAGICSDCRGTGKLVEWTDPELVLVTDRLLNVRAVVDDRAVPFVDWAQAFGDLTPTQEPEPVAAEAAPKRPRRAVAE